MSQGHLSASRNPEMRGQDCFDNLAMRSFFQDFKKDDYGSIIKCKMHDIMHDFALLLTKKGLSTTWEGGDKKTYHFMLLLESGGAQNIPDSIYNIKHLRTLVMECSQWSTYLRLDLLSSLTSLKALSLSYCGIEVIPDEIDNLMHLRYLDISGNDQIEKLPDTLCNLCNLQTLEMKDLLWLQKLPQGMGRLINLRHLNIVCSFPNTKITVPKGIGRLTSLQTLDMFVVPSPDETEASMKFEDLNKLKHLQGSLHIRYCKALDNAAVEKAQVLQNKPDIAELSFIFREYNQIRGLQHDDNIEDENILQALEPHRNLKFLYIEGYLGGKVSPSWLNSLINLKKLGLKTCLNCESLPILGTILPSLESISLDEMNKLEMVGLEFLGIELRDNIYNEAHSNRSISLKSSSSLSSFVSFPKLKVLTFSNMDNWRKWENISSSSAKEEAEKYNFTIMPCLCQLNIENCQYLQGIPDFLQNRPNLKITLV